MRLTAQEMMQVLDRALLLIAQQRSSETNKVANEGRIRSTTAIEIVKQLHAENPKIGVDGLSDLLVRELIERIPRAKKRKTIEDDE
jgi:hypothetical protein